MGYIYCFRIIHGPARMHSLIFEGCPISIHCFEAVPREAPAIMSCRLLLPNMSNCSHNDMSVRSCIQQQQNEQLLLRASYIDRKDGLLIHGHRACATPQGAELPHQGRVTCATRGSDTCCHPSDECKHLQGDPSRKCPGGQSESMPLMTQGCVPQAGQHTRRHLTATTSSSSWLGTTSSPKPLACLNSAQTPGAWSLLLT